ncbi:acylphosphatase [Telmatospirillum siberiense]|uniref:Acylphosphatase n=1 Tax=Telmatospirillum siberiense TaxID=382514 RepID=A0A2N3PNA8_9PROT|nr:acylphosphatase [Telmatospirillum siberiense]PKU21885.1 acylphosphatase [Telmatospirillum siberiense]
MADSLTLRVIIEGRVQGVWFRGWTIQEAGRRGLDGWVRNRSDGSVEALFSGPPEAVAAMVEACRQGPPSARVFSLSQWPAEAPAEKGFRPLPTSVVE